MSTLLLFTFNIFQIPFWISMLLILPTYMDGITQAYFNRESTNWLRLFTGIIAGIGMMSICAIIGKSIGLQLLDFLK
jgi:uncharacterized membrane protein